MRARVGCLSIFFVVDQLYKTWFCSSTGSFGELRFQRWQEPKMKRNIDCQWTSFPWTWELQRLPAITSTDPAFRCTTQQERLVARMLVNAHPWVRWIYLETRRDLKWRINHERFSVESWIQNSYRTFFSRTHVRPSLHFARRNQTCGRTFIINCNLTVRHRTMSD